MQNVFKKMAILVVSTAAMQVFPITSQSQAAYPVLMQKDPAIPVTVFNLTFRVGSADDPKGMEGIAALTAAMLREGGVKAWDGLPARSRSELEEYFYPYAARVSVSVHSEMISFQTRASAADSDALFKVLAQMILAPAWDPQEFLRLKAEQLDAVEKRAPAEDQEELGKAALEFEIFGKSHPYSHLTDGTVSGIQSITLEEVQKFYQQKFTQARLTVGVSGVISNTLSAQVKSAFLKLPPGEKLKVTLPLPSVRKQAKLLVVQGPFDAVGVHLGIPLKFNRASPEFPEMYLAAIAFGKHRSFVGRLMHVVREVRGLNYGTYSYVEDFPQGGQRHSEPTQVARQQHAFTVWGRPTPVENGCFLLKQIFRETSSLAQNGLTPQEFKMTQSHLVGSIPLMGMGLDRKLGYAIDSTFYGISGDYLKTLQGTIKNSRRESVHRRLKQNLDLNAASLVVVTPDPDRLIQEILSPRCDIHYAPGITKPQAVLDEDQQIATFALPLTRDQISVVKSDELFR